MADEPESKLEPPAPGRLASARRPAGSSPSRTPQPGDRLLHQRVVPFLAHHARQFGTLGGLVALGFVLWILTPHFLTVSNLLNIAQQTSINAIIAVGLTFVIISAGFVTLLCLHLGAVMALFATMPYGKFAHGVFRVATLLKWAIEKRQPSRLKLADD